jgi:hypothetical protein
MRKKPLMHLTLEEREVLKSYKVLEIGRNSETLWRRRAAKCKRDNETSENNGKEKMGDGKGEGERDSIAKGW